MKNRWESAAPKRSATPINAAARIRAALALAAPLQQAAGGLRGCLRSAGASITSFMQ